MYPNEFTQAFTCTVEITTYTSTEGWRFCPFCGGSIEREWRHCAHCGEMLAPKFRGWGVGGAQAEPTVAPV